MTALDYETALLGAVLRGYPDIAGLARTITHADFDQHRHGDIWQAVITVDRAGDVVDPLTVRAQLGSAVDKLPGGPLYLAELDAPTVASAPFYAAQVREKSVRRQVHGLGLRLQQRSEDLDAKPEDLVADVRRLADEISTPLRHVDVASALEHVIDIAQHGEPASTPSPWPSLDELTGGFYPGQLITFGARPGVGKSIALENIGTHIARTTGKYIAYCSLEMTAAEVLQRTLAHTAGVDLTRLRRGTCDDRDWTRISQSTDLIAQLPYRFQDFRPQTLTDIRAHARETAQEAKRVGKTLGAIIVDYVQLIKGTSTNRNMTRQQEVGEFTRDLKNLAGELQVPVITGAQLNRAGGNRASGIPLLSDLREAGDIEQDSDVVIFLHEEEVEDGGRLMKTGEIDLIVAKQRSGPTGTRRVRKAGHYARLYEG